MEEDRQGERGGLGPEWRGGGVVDDVFEKGWMCEVEGMGCGLQ